jgi:hypothetical protein
MKNKCPNDDARSKQLRRWWLVLEILRSSSCVTLARLATETGATERTVRRDLIALEAAGLPIFRTYENEHGSPWSILKTSPCPTCGHRAPVLPIVATAPNVTRSRDAVPVRPTAQMNVSAR